MFGDDEAHDRLAARIATRPRGGDHAGGTPRHLELGCHVAAHGHNRSRSPRTSLRGSSVTKPTRGGPRLPQDRVNVPAEDRGRRRRDEPPTGEHEHAIDEGVVSKIGAQPRTPTVPPSIVDDSTRPSSRPVAIRTDLRVGRTRLAPSADRTYRGASGSSPEARQLRTPPGDEEMENTSTAFLPSSSETLGHEHRETFAAVQGEHARVVAATRPFTEIATAEPGASAPPPTSPVTRTGTNADAFRTSANSVSPSSRTWAPCAGVDPRVREPPGRPAPCAARRAVGLRHRPPTGSAFRRAVASVPARTSSASARTTPPVPFPDHHAPSRHRRVSEGAAVDRPREADADRVGDGREDVDRLRVPSVIGPAALARILDKQRHPGDVGDVPGRSSSCSPGLEARTVIGGHYDHRAVVQPGRLGVGAASRAADRCSRPAAGGAGAPGRRAGPALPYVEGVVVDAVDRLRVPVLASRGSRR